MIYQLIFSWSYWIAIASVFIRISFLLLLILLVVSVNDGIVDNTRWVIIEPCISWSLNSPFHDYFDAAFLWFVDSECDSTAVDCTHISLIVLCFCFLHFFLRRDFVFSRTLSHGRLSSPVWCASSLHLSLTGIMTGFCTLYIASTLSQ